MRHPWLLWTTIFALAPACREAGLVDGDDDGATLSVDCDDADPAIHPGAAELCDGIDNDCVGGVDDNPTDGTTYFRDGDNDGAGDAASTLIACEAPTGYIADATDCDDTRGDVHPGATEDDCTDPTDYNCDGSVAYADEDGDGVVACEDCDDADDAVKPGAEETCNETDDDCDGETDENATDAKFWHADADGDTYGDASSIAAACEAPDGFVEDATDCHDGQAAIKPGATEVCDGADNDCDGTADEPDAEGAPTWYADGDTDGAGDFAVQIVACEAPDGFIADDNDCDDGDETSFPGGTEVCDGADNDCDGTPDDGLIAPWYADVDGDGHGALASRLDTCDPPTGYVSSSDDCNDAAQTALPGGSEVCDGLDNDCDGTPDDGLIVSWYGDGDGDGYGRTSVKTDSCATLVGFSKQAGDCDDAEAQVNPGAPEVCNDGRDDDCDGLADDEDDSRTGGDPSWTDADLDGYGDPITKVVTCVMPADNVDDGTDCNDDDQDVNPAASEVWYNGVDDACDGGDDYDQDMDGHKSQAHGGDDEVDTDPTCYTGCIGMSQAGAANSCKAIKTANPTAASGTYWVDTDADGNKANARQTHCDMTGQGGGWTRCFTFTNTAAEDLTGNSWFDTCVTDSMSAGVAGAEVRVVLVNASGLGLYDHYGTRPSTWSFDNLTSTIGAQDQYLSNNHGRLVPLDNGDKLMIAGRFSANAGCGGSYGNGYGITVYPSAPNYYSNPKMFVGTYQQTIAPWTSPRYFSGWSPSHEISGTGNSSYDSCSSTPAQLGTFSFYVR